MVSAYPQITEAESHQKQLQHNEGKILNLQEEADKQKLLTLVKPNSGYSFFYRTISNASAIKKVNLIYKHHVASYVKNNALGYGKFELTLKIVAGRVMAEITFSKGTRTVLFYDIIK